MDKDIFEFTYNRHTYRYNSYVDRSQVEFVVLAPTEREARAKAMQASADLEPGYKYRLVLLSVKHLQLAL